MENFEFLKTRDIGSLFQDYISLFKMIFKHFNLSILRFTLPFISILVVGVYLARGYIWELFYSTTGVGFLVIATTLVFSLLLFLYFVFIASFGVEYMFLLEKNRDTSFTNADILSSVKSNFGKYIKFFLAAILFLLIVSVPVGGAMAILIFVPIAGQLLVGVLTTTLTLFIFFAFFLYLQGRSNLTGSFRDAYRLLSRKFFNYALSAYIFQFLISIIIGVLIFVPVVFFTVLELNSTISLTMGSVFKEIFIIVLLVFAATLTALLSIYNVAFYVLAYFSALETRHSDGTLDKIDQIGKSNDFV